MSRVQLKNVLSSMDVTLEGIFIDVSELQSSNAPSPMDSTPSGISTDVSKVQSLNALTPMDVTPSDIVTVCIFALLTSDVVHQFTHPSSDSIVSVPVVVS